MSVKSNGKRKKWHAWSGEYINSWLKCKVEPTEVEIQIKTQQNLKYHIDTVTVLEWSDNTHKLTTEKNEWTAREERC